MFLLMIKFCSVNFLRWLLFLLTKFKNTENNINSIWCIIIVVINIIIVVIDIIIVVINKQSSRPFACTI